MSPHPTVFLNGLAYNGLLPVAAVLKYQQKKPIYIIRNDTVEIRIQGGIVAARSLSSVFMVHSISAVSTAGRVAYDQERGRDSSDREQQAGPHSFAKILQQEVEEQKTDSVHYKTVTYGRDLRLHSFEYLTRDYSM